MLNKEDPAHHRSIGSVYGWNNSLKDTHSSLLELGVKFFVGGFFFCCFFFLSTFTEVSGDFQVQPHFITSVILLLVHVSVNELFPLSR